MFEQIRELARLLDMGPGELATLARLVAQDGALVDLEYLRHADAVELKRILELRAEAVVSYSLT